MAIFNEDTRVKIPATIQFLRLGYNYQSLKTDDVDIDFNTKIFVNRFKPALERINGRDFTYDEIKSIQLKKRIIVARNHSRTVYNWHIIGQDDTELQLIPNDDYRNISQYLTMAGDAFHLLEVADNRRKTILKP